jgi:hypothetical protein
LEFIMPPVTQRPLAPFATLTPERRPRERWSIAQLFSAPFRDVDERVARKAEAERREREARLVAAMSGAAEPRR